MRLQTVYTRFFRSLNYDYLRASHPKYHPDPWDSTPSAGPYPFVRLKLEPDITTIVGANESGKSQLLEAIKRGLTGEDIRRGDFCRYSQFFSSDDRLTRPEFGLTFCDLADAERVAAAAVAGTDVQPDDIQSISLFRVNETPQLRLYVHGQDGAPAGPFHVKKPTALLSGLRMPQFFAIDSNVPLPDSVPLAYLASGELSDAVAVDEHRRRWDRVADSFMTWFSSEQAIAQSAPTIASALGGETTPRQRELDEYQLADDLLMKVVGLERELFTELRDAARRRRHGYADGIIERINSQIATRLNFPHWWTQDSSFELFVGLTEFDLKFMIRDRTGTTYSFDERSAGLKYFLSYFVQYQSHEPREDGLPEILLMDEPDAFLSSSGQQDLLRIFDAFAFPDRPGVPPVQIVYVTHSPFLIDKNHSERIRVLEKGENDEGTRVVANASRNHYEPLRSAFGSFVGETTFIGTCNLLLEGASDQILLAGVSNWLAHQGVATTQRLDLNNLTLVPAGSASQIPYLAYLARGRDVDRPAVIVLLDADAAGDDASAALARGGPRGRQLVAPAYVLQLSDSELSGVVSDNHAGPVGIEDLIPAEIAIEATRMYCREFLDGFNADAFHPPATALFADGGDTIGGLERLLAAQAGAPVHLDKIGFARSVIAVAPTYESTDAGAQMKNNFVTLLSALTRRQRQADRDIREEKVRTRVNRERKRFITDHPDGARREEVMLLIESIERQLDTSAEADEVRLAMNQWHRGFALDDDPRSPLDDYPAFVKALESVAYAGVQTAQDGE